MPHHRLFRAASVSIIACGALLSTSACDRSTPALHTDSVSIQAESVSAIATTATDVSGWIRSAGPALFVQGETRNEAIVLLPTEDDTVAATRLRVLGNQGAEVTLFGRGGARLTAQLGAPPQAFDAECRVWPLRGIRGEGTDNTWAVGFIVGQTAPLALDSVDVLSSRDSLALAAEASRLASMVTAMTAPSFQGLRFTAHDIRRFEALPGVQAIVAHLVRKVNQEANPQEEQTLLIAERDSGVMTGPYQLVYAERTHGLEETTTMPEVIAGVRIAGRPMLVVARDGAEGVAYALLERTGPRQWRIRWTSGLTRCG
jgi:hypothetical protein